MKILFILHTNFGKFESDYLEVNSEQYAKLQQISKTYYTGDYEMYLPNGFLVASPDVLKNSILEIKITENDTL